MNPYRAAERTVAAVGLLLIAATLAGVAWLITITESWAALGWLVLTLSGAFGFAILREEWSSISEWWCKKREAWDAKHSSAPVGEKP